MTDRVNITLISFWIISNFGEDVAS